MPHLPPTTYRKHVQFDARYATSALNGRIAAREGRGAILEGLEVARNGANTIRVFPGKALLPTGLILELTAAQNLTLPVGLVRPFSLFLQADNQIKPGTVRLEFAKAGQVPADATVLREWPDASPGGTEVFGARLPDAILGVQPGVRGRLAARATGLPNQAVFPLSGFSFFPATDTLLVFAAGLKIRPVNATLNGLKTITLAVPIATGAKFEAIAIGGVRFREEQTGLAVALITLAPGNSYTQVLGDLLVFKNGILLEPVAGYAETSSTSITLTVAAVPGDVFELYGVEGLLHRETQALIAATDVQLATHQHRPGSLGLWIFGDGLRKTLAYDYAETSPESLTLEAAFTGSLHAIVFRSVVPDADTGRELGERLDLGRGLADAIRDPDSERAVVASAVNPIITKDDLTENTEVITARGGYDTLSERLAVLAKPNPPGGVAAHGTTHTSVGTDPVPNVIANVSDGLVSPVDATKLQAHFIEHAGGAEHAVATPSVAGFLSGGDKLKLDDFPVARMWRGMWSLRFFDDGDTGHGPGTLISPAKGGRVFYFITQDGSIPSTLTNNGGNVSLAIQFKTAFTASAATSAYFSLSAHFMGGPRLFLNGNPIVLTNHSGRADATMQIAAGIHVVDVIFYAQGGFTVFTGAYAGILSDLFASGKPIVWTGAP